MNRLMLGLYPVLCGTAQLNAQVQVFKPVIVTVINKHEVPAKPVSDARVTLSFFNGSQKITDARQRTNRLGQTELQVSSEAQDRGDLRIEVSDAPGLVVYQPSEGLLTAVPRTLEVVLLPKGSPALLEPAQIEAMLNRLSGLSLKIQQLKVSLDKAEKQKTDFDQALESWATDHGLSYSEVNAHVQTWAEDVLAHKNEVSLARQAEAELGLRHYERAGLLFQSAMNTSRVALHREQENYLKGVRRDLLDAVQLSSKSASALQAAQLYHQASMVSQDGLAEAQAQYEHYPTDPAIRHTWSYASFLAIYAHWKEAQGMLTDVDGGKDPRPLFASTLEESRTLAAKMDRVAEPDFSLYATMMTQVVSIYLAEASDSATGAGLRRQAVKDSQAILASYDHTKDPQGWAAGESMLGLLLAAEAARGVTDVGFGFDQASEELIESQKAFEASLLVYTKAGDPANWSTAQAKLGDLAYFQARIQQARNQSPEQKLLQAESYYRQALTVIDRKDAPKTWAALQGELAGTLSFRAEISDPPHAVPLWQQAVAASQAELAVYSRSESPRQWANAQGTLALILFSEGQHATPDLAPALFSQAIEAYRAELSVFSKANFAPRWAGVQESLADALIQLAIRTPQPRQGELLDEAIAANRSGLEVFTTADFPERWASARAILASFLVLKATKTDPATSRLLLIEAAGAYTDSLTVHPADVPTLDHLGSIYHDALFDFEKAYLTMAKLKQASPTDGNQLNLAEAAFTTSRFSECIQIAQSLDESKLKPDDLPARRTLLFACQWGAGQSSQSATTASSLQELASSTLKFSWNSSGDLIYLEHAAPFASTGCGKRSFLRCSFVFVLVWLRCSGGLWVYFVR